MAGDVAAHALQVGAGGAARRAQTGDDGDAIAADGQKAAAGARRDAVGLIEVHLPREAARIQSHVDVAAPRLQIQTGIVGGHHGVDVDVVDGAQREFVRAPAEVGIDMDVAKVAAIRRSRCRDADIAAAQRSLQRARTHATAGLRCTAR